MLACSCLLSSSQLHRFQVWSNGALIPVCYSSTMVHLPSRSKRSASHCSSINHARPAYCSRAAPNHVLPAGLSADVHRQCPCQRQQSAPSFPFSTATTTPRGFVWFSHSVLPRRSHTTTNDCRTALLPQRACTQPGCCVFAVFIVFVVVIVVGHCL